MEAAYRIVARTGVEVLGLIAQLERIAAWRGNMGLHVDADFVLATTHKRKGGEADHVQLADDFCALVRRPHGAKQLTMTRPALHCQGHAFTVHSWPPCVA